jgi:hypothetical protein
LTTPGRFGQDLGNFRGDRALGVIFMTRRDHDRHLEDLRHIGQRDRLLGCELSVEEVAADDLAAGRLRRISPDWQAKSTPVYALTETRLLPAKTQRFIEFVQERLGQQAGARRR